MVLEKQIFHPHEGFLPESWKILPAKEVCVKVTDGTHDTPKPSDSGVPYITAINVKDGYINFDNCQYLPEKVHREIYKRCNPEKGDLLVVNIGAGVAECGYVSVDYEFSLKNVALLKPDKNKITSEFLFHHHQYKKGKIAHRVKSGGAQPFLSLKDLRLLKFVVPPLPEQKKIAKILSTWDRAIEVTEKLLENSRQQKKSLMQQLLTGKKRLPGFSGEWKEVELGSIAKYSKGYTYKSKDYSDIPTQYGFFTLKSIEKGGGFNRNGIKFLTKKVDQKFEVKPGDIIFAVTDITRDAAVVGAPVFVPDLGLSFSSISMDMVRLDVSEEIDRKFLFYALKIRDARCFMRARASGSTVLHLDVKGSKKLKICIPNTLKEQQKIASVLSTADKEIEVLQKKLECLRQEKKALMQQLLTGKRRVKVDEAEMPKKEAARA